MSVQATCKTPFNDEPTLIEALEELCGKGTVTKHETGVEVRGYSSKKKPTITVKVNGMYGTAGYVKGSDGNFELVYDSMDKHRLSGLIPTVKGKQKVDKLAQSYARIRVLKELKKQNRKVVNTEKRADGSIKIRVRVNAF